MFFCLFFNYNYFEEYGMICKRNTYGKKITLKAMKADSECTDQTLSCFRREKNAENHWIDKFMPTDSWIVGKTV